MNEKTYEIIQQAEQNAQKLFNEIDNDIALFNQNKVLDAFRKNRVSLRHFAPTTGYGYDDIGRDTLAKVFSDVFCAENSIVSPNILSGTHALTIALFGILRPNDLMISVTGAPYDTLNEVILGKNIGSLAEYGIKYDQVELTTDGKLDFDEISRVLSEKQPKLVFITRSKGYAWRDALSIKDIENATKIIKKASPNSIIMVDNCYGEFTDKKEPLEVGADIIVGSLIKNVGGGIAPTGGYIAGKSDCIEQIGYRLTSPSIGTEVGSYNSSYLPFYEGLFFAPTVVASAVKGSILAGFAFKSLGYEVNPEPETRPGDIIRSIKFNTAEELISFVQGVQYSSPVDSHVTPEPWEMPGYQHQVIMAAGTFVQGASLELSADSPIKEPYIAYLQGGLTYQHCKIAIAECIERIIK